MSKMESFSYDNKIVRNFAIASVVYGIIGMLVGLTVAFQLYYPSLNLNTSWFSLGRIRPLHTNAVIFAFVGNGIFAGSYYSMQRLLKTRMYSDVLSNIHFWGWQLIILSAAITLPLGLMGPHEYAELEWPQDIAIALIWVIYGINMIGTLLVRRERHLYVAIWFYLATFVTVAMLHIFNNIELPISAFAFKSYPVIAGVKDALVQWWYGHNAVAFFLTTPYLGLMYYFLPKAANRPVYSYRLSIIHFWALIFIYIWAGPHHLLYTALPEWTQSLGTVFSIMLIAPSWGGMLNGLLTLRGAWDKVRVDPILKFMVVAVTCYGMSTFEGPMLAIKTVNSISHYTDWTVGHVHIGTLGWNGMLTFGVFYWMIPRMYGVKLHSVKHANTHFWLGTLGIVFYAIPLYFAAWTQYLMWRQFTPDGLLKYPNFLETVTQILPMYLIRAIGGTIYFTGVCLMVWNLGKTMIAGKLIANEEAQAPALEPYAKHASEHWHRVIERKPIQLTIFSLIAVAIGGVVEYMPLTMIDSNIPIIESVKPYTPLELEGRDIYLREGCVACHSQMIRPFRWETERYGEFSKSGEFIYDRPFLWGSKRTGPDLHRVGGKYDNAWHFKHMYDPREMSPGSIMPRYSWMIEDNLNTKWTNAKIKTLQSLGTPYPEDYAEGDAMEDLRAQAKEIADDLRGKGIDVEEGNLEEREIIAMIAYLQRLGTDIKNHEE